MTKEKVSLGFRQKIDETRIYLGKEIKYND